MMNSLSKPHSKNTTRNWKHILVWVLKATAVSWIVNFVFLALLAATGSNWVNLVETGFFSMMLLVETAMFLLIGGIIAFSSSIFASKFREQFLKSEEKWSIHDSESAEKKANLYILTGVLLFVQSLVISL